MKRFAITLIIVMAAITAKSQDYITINYDMTSYRSCTGFVDENHNVENYSIKDNVVVTIKYCNKTNTAETWISKNGNKTHYRKFNNVKLVVKKYDDTILGFDIVDDNYRYAVVFDNEFNTFGLGYRKTKIK